VRISATGFIQQRRRAATDKGAVDLRPHARDRRHRPACGQRRNKAPQRTDALAAHHEIDLRREKVFRQKGRMVAADDGPTPRQRCLDLAEDRQRRQDVHREGGDPDDIRRDFLHRPRQRVGVEPQIEYLRLMPIERQSCREILERERLRDRAEISPTEHLVARVRPDQQDFHGPSAGSGDRADRLGDRGRAAAGGA
jgi:hypothetical protein